MDTMSILTAMPRMAIANGLADAVKNASAAVDWSQIDQTTLAVALLSSAGQVMQGTR